MTAGFRQPDEPSPARGGARPARLGASVPGQPVTSAAEIEGRKRVARAAVRAGAAGPRGGAGGAGLARPTVATGHPDAVRAAESTEWPAVGGGMMGAPPPMARPRAAAGALFFDEAGRVLLVEPSYKPGWDIPGGFIEPGESPYAACVREVEEEIGIVPPIGPLLVVDWASDDQVGDMLLFVFDGGLLPTAWRQRIRLDMREIINCAFTPLAEVGERLPVLHARRVRAAAGRRGSDAGTAYLEHGYLVPAGPTAEVTVPAD